MRYLYSVIRFVPDTTREEFVNVGLVVLRDAPETGVETITKVVADWRRARALAEDDQWVLALKVIDDMEPPETADRLNTLRQNYRNCCVQFRPALPAVGNDAKEVLARLWKSFIRE